MANTVLRNGTVVSNLYDSAGRLAAVVAMRGGEEERVSLVYDPAGRLESVSAEGDETAYLQDEYALLVEIDVAYDGDVVRVGELSVNRNPATGFVGMLGAERDPTGLLFMRNRYYSPTLGRFLTRTSSSRGPSIGRAVDFREMVRYDKTYGKGYGDEGQSLHRHIQG